MEIANFNGFSYKSSNEDYIDVLTITIRKDKYGQRY